jgi:hypothetical protein
VAAPRRRESQSHMIRLASLAALVACAPLNTATMSPACRYEYNACLNRCPKAALQPAGDRPPDMYADQADVAICTRRCNEQATACKL